MLPTFVRQNSRIGNLPKSCNTNAFKCTTDCRNAVPGVGSYASVSAYAFFHRDIIKAAREERGYGESSTEPVVREQQLLPLHDTQKSRESPHSLTRRNEKHGLCV